MHGRRVTGVDFESDGFHSDASRDYRLRVRPPRMSETDISTIVGRVLASPRLAFMVTRDRHGLPHISMDRVGVDADEIVAAQLELRQKVVNLRHDPRIVVA